MAYKSVDFESEKEAWRVHNSSNGMVDVRIQKLDSKLTNAASCPDLLYFSYIFIFIYIYGINRLGSAVDRIILFMYITSIPLFT